MMFPMRRQLSLLSFALMVPGLVAAQEFVWAPKKAPDAYAGPHRPHTKLADLKARHAGKAEWQDVMVDDELLKSVYLQLKPGYKSRPALHPDTRAWWVVVEGEVKFNVEGTAPFVARKGSMVQVPMTTIFSYEAVGDKPVLLFETNIAQATTVYLADQAAPNLKGIDMMKMKIARRPGDYLRNNKVHTTFEELAAKLEAGSLKGTQKVVEDDRGAANFIYGYEKNLGKLNLADRGHFHTETAEYWLIMSGQIRYRIEGHEVFIAEPGDVVYVPRNRWHLARWYGPGPSTRLAMNGYPNLMHFYDPEMTVPGNK